MASVFRVSLCYILALLFLVSACGSGNEEKSRSKTEEQTPSTTQVQPNTPMQPNTSETVPSPQQTPQSTGTVKLTLAGKGLPEGGMWKSAPALGDVNGDGFTDMAAVAREGDGPHVWLGDGKGVWTDTSKGLTLPGSCSGGLRFADVNKDSKPDLIYGDSCKGIFVFFGDGTGQWRLATEKLAPQAVKRMDNVHGVEDVDVGDVNGDGFPDLIGAAAFWGGFTVYLGDGSGTNWKEVTEPDGLPNTEDYQELKASRKGGRANQMTLRDVNGDGFLDIAATYNRGPRVWLGNGKAQWQEASTGLPTPVIGGIFMGIDLGDVNEDGRLDIIVGNEINGPEVFLQKEDGTWQPTADAFPAMQGGAFGVAVGDIDRDGHLDIVTGGRKNRDPGDAFGYFVLLGDGKGGWKEATDTGLPESGLQITWKITVKDINGDGAPDIATAVGGSFEEEVPEEETPEGEQQQAQKKPAFPHVQVWLNESPKK